MGIKALFEKNDAGDSPIEAHRGALLAIVEVIRIHLFHRSERGLNAGSASLFGSNRYHERRAPPAHETDPRLRPPPRERPDDFLRADRGPFFQAEEGSGTPPAIAPADRCLRSGSFPESQRGYQGIWPAHRPGPYINGRSA